MVSWLWTERIAHHEFYEKIDKKMNTTSYNITYLVDNKTNLCIHNKLHPLTARKVQRTTETMDRDIEKSFIMIHRNISLQ